MKRESKKLEERLHNLQKEIKLTGELIKINNTSSDDYKKIEEEILRNNAEQLRIKEELKEEQAKDLEDLWEKVTSINNINKEIESKKLEE